MSKITEISFAPEKKGFSSRENMIYYVMKNVSGSGKEMTDAEKRKIEARIRAKLKSGKKLSSKEMDYLRRYNTALYQQALRVQKTAEAVERQLRSAKSKEEVRDIIGRTMTGIPDEDPAKEYLVAAIQEVAKEFKKSDAYSKLPETKEEAKNAGKSRKAKQSQKVNDKQEKTLGAEAAWETAAVTADADSMAETGTADADSVAETGTADADGVREDDPEAADLYAWTPLQEIIDAMPKFSSEA